MGIYQSNLPKECGYIVDHSDGILVFAENEEQLEKLVGIKAQIANVRKVVLFNGEPHDKNEWVMRFDRFLTLGKNISDEDFQSRVSQTKPDDPACIVYTSGTTGVPKGAVLTHDNLTFTAQSVVKSCDIREGDEIFLFSAPCPRFRSGLCLRGHFGGRGHHFQSQHENPLRWI